MVEAALYEYVGTGNGAQRMESNHPLINAAAATFTLSI